MIPNETPINVALEIGEKYSLDNTISVDTDKTDIPNQAGYALEEATYITKEEIKSGRKKSAVSIIDADIEMKKVLKAKSMLKKKRSTTQSTMLSAEESRSVFLADISKIESSITLSKVGEKFSVKKSDTKGEILSPENKSYHPDQEKRSKNRYGSHKIKATREKIITC